MALNRRTVTYISLHKVCLILVVMSLLGMAINVLANYISQAPLHVAYAIWGGLIAALATALGAFPVIFTKQPSQQTQDLLFGFGAGVMLAACTFSLIVPGLGSAVELGFSGWAAAGYMATSVLLGAAVLVLVERMLPHEHFIKGIEGQRSSSLRRSWLFVFAIALHNLPEGLAIGTVFAGNSVGGASALSIGIAIQNVPEGLIIALALTTVGYSRCLSVSLAILSGLIEPLGALLGVSMVTYSAGILPWSLGFAAGAMLFVVSHEIIPESHRKGHERHATAGLMTGFVVMMVLDTALG